MKVYAITKGCYSDYHICCVVGSEEQAKKAVKLYSDRYDAAMIEEFDTDDISKIPEGTTLWYATYDTIEKRIVGISDVPGDHLIRSSPSIEALWSDRLFVSVNARDENHAIKLVLDAVAKYLAEKQGL